MRQLTAVVGQTALTCDLDWKWVRLATRDDKQNKYLMKRFKKTPWDPRSACLSLPTSLSNASLKPALTSDLCAVCVNQHEARLGHSEVFPEALVWILERFFILHSFTKEKKKSNKTTIFILWVITTVHLNQPWNRFYLKSFFAKCKSIKLEQAGLLMLLVPEKWLFFK